MTTIVPDTLIQVTDYRPALPEHVARLYSVSESRPLLRFDRQHLPDLDDLLLYLASIDGDGEPRYRDGGDQPTSLSGCDRELCVHCFRIVPCSPMSCGEHGWHVHPVKGALDWSDSRRSGVFLGVWE